MMLFQRCCDVTSKQMLHPGRGCQSVVVNDPSRSCLRPRKAFTIANPTPTPSTVPAPPNQISSFNKSRSTCFPENVTRGRAFVGVSAEGPWRTTLRQVTHTTFQECPPPPSVRVPNTVTAGTAAVNVYALCAYRSPRFCIIGAVPCGGTSSIFPGIAVLPIRCVRSATTVILV